MQYVPITQKSRYSTNLPSEVAIFSQSTNRRNICPRSSDTIASFDIIASVSSVSYKKQYCEQLGNLMGIAHQRDVYTTSSLCPFIHAFYWTSTGRTFSSTTSVMVVDVFEHPLNI